MLESITGLSRVSYGVSGIKWEGKLDGDWKISYHMPGMIHACVEA